MFDHATTTQAVRRAIHAPQESVRVLAGYHGIDPTTVQKWRRRDYTTGIPMAPWRCWNQSGPTCGCFPAHACWTTRLPAIARRRPEWRGWTGHRHRRWLLAGQASVVTACRLTACGGIRSHGATSPAAPSARLPRRPPAAPCSVHPACPAAPSSEGSCPTAAAGRPVRAGRTRRPGARRSRR